MRVIGGAARGRRLKRPAAGVRPTSDLVRGAIFDVLEAQGVDRSRVLDLYAGSGALGIEALSRGSEWCDFVERSAANVALIRENLALTGLQERGRVHQLAVERAPEGLEGPYSLLLADPPYDDDAALAALERIARSRLVGPGTTLVLEQSRRRQPPEELGPLRLSWNRRYGDTQVSVYRQLDAPVER
ncbi:MAG: 16S rRNA (guanine(966)-N(2))-methyltransferase RsmD [Chloroflexi bacterium RBG_16_68_14]|nr:MAG: 16S rRNA (guanine(966)-N(2))-methyltransferase RsmD [Chloroflexi bacterium RBG_16_68_14]